MGDGCEICFRLLGWGKGNEHFGKIIITNQIENFIIECGGEFWRTISIRYD